MYFYIANVNVFVIDSAPLHPAEQHALLLCVDSFLLNSTSLELKMANSNNTTPPHSKKEKDNRPKYEYKYKTACKCEFKFIEKSTLGDFLSCLNVVGQCF